MKRNIINYLISGILFSLLIISCEDNIDTEITEESFDRLMSVTDVSADVKQREVTINFSENDKAESYVIQLYNDSIVDFNDESLTSSLSSFVEEVSILAESLPYKTTLLAEEDYSVRIQAVSEGIDQSKWSGLAFKTAAENILNTLSSDNITKKSVTLSWPAGSEVNYFKVKPTDGSASTDSIRITDEQIEIGEATITGLSYETEYQVSMYQDGNPKRRGRVTFTTKADGVTLSDGADIAVAINTDNPDENVFFLQSGTYTSSEKIEVTRDIKIVPVSTSDVVSITGAQFKFTTGEASLTIQDVELNGNSAVDDLFSFDSGLSGLGSIVLSGSYIHDYTDDFFYFGKAGFVIDALTVDDCIINSFGCSHSFIDIRNGLVSNISFTNSTIANCGAASSNYLIRYDGATKGPNEFDDGSTFPVITISDCTLYNNFLNCSKSLVYARWAEDGLVLNMSNNVMGAPTAYNCGLFDTSVSTPVTNLSANYYFNAENLMEDDASGTKIASDPFTDAASNDFTLTNGISAGDPRWIPAAE